jgi:hypothetical protein
MNNLSTTELSNTLLTLEKYIEFILDNSYYFLNEFCEGDSLELINVSFTGHRCKIVYMLDSGQHVCTDIYTGSVIEWIGDMSE